MQRTKVMAVVAALVVAGAAAVVLAGGASAASWHVYQGNMYAGHAYGLQVPGDADSIEFAFEGAEASKASISVYTPEGEKAGTYELTPDLPKASIADPDAGQYVVYVYDVTEGALAVRVQSDEEPALDLAEVPLVRDDAKLGTFEKGALSQVISADLDAQPVFLTLLYEGSSRNLDATVSGAEGAIVTIAKESATAFSPGVWTTLKGERSFDASKLAGTSFKVEVHADDFEGTLVLTTLALDIRHDAPIAGFLPLLPGEPSHPEHPSHPTPAKAPAMPGAADATFALRADEAIAFAAPAGQLVLSLPPSEDDADEHDHGAWATATVTIYTPDDKVLDVVELDHNDLSATVALPVAGEYVAYTTDSGGDPVLASIVGARAPPALRSLAIEEERIAFEKNDLFNDEMDVVVQLAHVPLDVALFYEDGIGAMSDARLENENGVVARANGMVVLPGAPMGGWGYDRATFASGEHLLSIGGLFEGTVALVTTHYVRASEVEPSQTIEDADEETDEDGPWTPLDPPSPEALPMPAAAPLLAPRVLAQLGL